MNSEDAHFSPSEQARINAVARLLFNVWGSIHEAYESNLINEALYESMSKDVVVQMQAAPAAIPIWVEMIRDYPDRQSHPILAPRGLNFRLSVSPELTLGVSMALDPGSPFVKAVNSGLFSCQEGRFFRVMRPTMSFIAPSKASIFASIAS